MSSRRFDVVVAGAGPAGSITAAVLARGGARVALVDKARFPRDKACGDLVGPRGLQVLADLGLAEPPGLDVGDMTVVGPTGRRVTLPSFDGASYPGRALAVGRAVFDAHLRQAALEAGAEPVEGRIARLSGEAGAETPRGVVLGDGHELVGEFVVGADGATSRVAEVAGLVDPARVLWGFAIRSYVDQPVALPTIVLWEQARWHAFPGYGWIFPGPEGTANLGLGVGTLADRQGGSAAVRLLARFTDHLADLGLLGRTGRAASVPVASRRLGGWLKMGMVGTVPAHGRVLLVGDAAGLVNPLQGEGIAQAMTSGRDAAEAILGHPGRAAAQYLDRLAAAHLPYQRITAAAHTWLVRRPAAVATVGRLLTLPGIGPAVAGGWGIFWNELLDGASPGPSRRLAGTATAVGRAATARTDVARWFDRSFGTGWRLPNRDAPTERGQDPADRARVSATGVTPD